MNNEMKAMAPTTSPGRPRDRRIDEAVIAATRELLAAEGYSSLSLAAVAARAGTNTPAIYRRWPSKVHLVHEAMFPADLAAGAPSSGDLRSDVAELVRGSAALFSDPLVRTALPGLISDLAQHPELHRQLMDRLWGSRLQEVQDQLDQAAENGLVRSGVRADHLLSVIGGSALLSVLAPSGEVLDAAWTESITALVLEGITP